MPDYAARVPGTYRTHAGKLPHFTGDMPDFRSCVIERLFTVYFTQSVPDCRIAQKKNAIMPGLVSEMPDPATDPMAESGRSPVSAYGALLGR